MSDATAGIRLAVEDRELIEGLKRTTDAIKSSMDGMADAAKSSWTEMSSMLNVLGKGFDLLTGAVSAIASEMVELGKEAAEADKAGRQLANTLRSQTGATDAQIEAILQHNAAIERKLGIDADDIAQIQKRLAVMHVQADEINNATRYTIGLAHAMDIDMGAAGRLVAKTLDGNVAALKKYGIAVKDQTGATAEFEKMWQVAAKDAETLETRVQILTTNYGNFREELGETIIKSGALSASIDTLNGFITKLTDLLGTTEGQKIVNEFFKALASGASLALRAFLAVYDAIQQTMALFGGRGKAIIELLNLANPTMLVTESGRAMMTDAFKRLFSGSAEDAARATAKDPELIASLRAMSAELALVGSGDISANTGGATADRQKRRGGGAGPAEKKAKTLHMGDVFSDVEQEIEQQRAFAEEMINLKHQQAQAEADIDLQRLIQQREGVDARNEERLREAQGMRDTVKTMAKAAAEITASGIANSFVALGEAIGTGFKDAGELFREVVGGLLKTLGLMLIQMGTAGVLAGTLGTVIPAFAALTGGPLGVAAGTAAIAGGVLMTAIGAALGGGGPSSAGATAGSGFRQGGGASAGSRSFAPEGFTNIPTSNETAPVTLNLNFGGQALITKREIGAAVNEALEEYRSLVTPRRRYA